MDNLVELNLLVEKYVADEVSQKGLAEIALRQTDAKFREFAKALVHIGANGESNLSEDVLSEIRDAFKRDSFTLRQVQNKTRSAEKQIQLATNRITKLDQTTRNMATQVDRILDATKLANSISFINTGVGLANIAVDIAGFQLIDQRLNKVDEQLQKQAQILAAAEKRDENAKSSKCLKLCRKYTQIMNRVKDNDTISYDDLETAIGEYESFIYEMVLNLTQRSLPIDMSLDTINALLPAYTSLIVVWLDQYYRAKGKEPDNLAGFISLFDKLLAEPVICVIQDYYFIERKNSFGFVNSILAAYILLVLNSRAQVEDKFDTLEYLKNGNHTSGEFETVISQYENELRGFLEKKCKAAKERLIQNPSSTVI